MKLLKIFPHTPDFDTFKKIISEYVYFQYFTYFALLILGDAVIIFARRAFISIIDMNALRATL